MKNRIAGSAVAVLVAAVGVLVTATPAQAHRQCFTTSSTTTSYGRSGGTYCTGKVSCEWVVTKSHYVYSWKGRKKVIDAREFRCW